MKNDMMSGAKEKSAGFTLIEAMIIVAIMAILATIAYPSYQANVRKAKRNDALEALLRIQVAQEKWRVSDTDYATLEELGSPSSMEGFYTITVSLNTATSYTITASALGDQANDEAEGTSCSSLTLAVSAGGETKTPATCW